MKLPRVANLARTILGDHEPLAGWIAKRRLGSGWISCSVRLLRGNGLSRRWRSGLVRVSEGTLYFRPAPFLPGRRVKKLPIGEISAWETDDAPTGPGAWGLRGGLQLLRVRSATVSFDLAVRPDQAADALDALSATQ